MRFFSSVDNVMTEDSNKTVSQTTKKKTNFSTLLVEMLISIFLPTLILKKLSDAEQLGPTLALIVALSLPLGYGIYQFIQSKKFGFIPVLGFISILLTGGIGLLQLDAKYIAIKEAAIPFVIGLASLISLKTPYPLVKTFLYNDMMLQVDKVNAALAQKNNTLAFEKTLNIATYLLTLSFFLSSFLNYTLAKIVVVAMPGTSEFNDQLGTMNLLSYPVIVLPCMIISVSALIYLFKKIRELTGYTLEEIVNEV